MYNFVRLANLQLLYNRGFLFEAKAIWEHTCIAGGLLVFFVTFFGSTKNYTLKTGPCPNKNTAVALSHSRMYLISTTHSFLISYRFFFSLAPYLSSTPRLPHHLWQGTLQADASLRTARRFSKSLADYNLESILFFFEKKFVSLSPSDDPGEKPAKVHLQL